ncbi:MAG: 30S ribosomal protein S18 [Candidatus Koribacter versatilis]|uniref:Small ribosomal subunit protein bS18 n=1 Tax=Candidatus Korobacter versatilis TaxID=658062 RepID=A0A932A7T8_9BACT|nr:30S ribosomal protein S18 [Candidatus Koribacter versatilis]
MADEVKQPKEATATAEPSTTTAAPATPAERTYPAATPHTPRPYTPRPSGDRGPGGPRREGRPGGGPGGPRGDRKFFRRKKVCKFCVEKIDAIDYKDVGLLRQFVAERGKIVPRRLTGVCTPHQRRLSAAIKQARNIALLPFQARF